MKITWRFFCGWLILAGAASVPAQYAFQSLDFPTASTNSGGTMAQGISDGNIVGTYYDANRVAHGFLYDGSTYTSLDDTNSFVSLGAGSNVYYGTYALGISGGEIVGWYTSPDGINHGFIFSNGSYTNVDEPDGYQNTVATGVSDGDIVGYYIDINGVTHGFFYDGTNYTTLDDPNALNSFFGATFANGIDGGKVVGYYASPANHGFVYNSGAYLTLDYPDTVGFTEAFGISGTNIDGYYSDTNANIHAFLYNGNAFTSIDYPGSSHTYATGIWSNTMVGYYIDSTNNTHGFVASPGSGVKPVMTGSLQVNIMPAGAVTAGAQWQVDGGSFQNSGATVTNLSVRGHALSFEPVPGWTPPPDQAVTVSNRVTATVIGLYTASAVPTNGLILVTNGLGSIQHGPWPASLVVGKTYTVQAMPAAGNLFENWVGGATLPYSILSSSASYTFTMQSGLLLEAHFVTDPFLTAHGSYRGLFAPENSDRAQTNSGSFHFMLTSGGTLSGSLLMGSQSEPLTGKFGADGNATITSKRHNGTALTSTLQLDPANQAVTGTVSDGNFIAPFTGYQDVFSTHNRMTNYAGRYTMIIPGTNNSAIGPYGTSYGTVIVKPTGTISFAGSLADGTAVSQSSMVSEGGYWPFYLSLYGGKGSLWSWISFTTNGATASTSTASWINPTNTSKSALYRSGFTNQAATITNASYDAGNEPLLVLINAQLILEGGDLPLPITDQVQSLYNQVIFTSTTNGIMLLINPTTGFISGSFRNPTDSTKLIKLNGVLEPGQVNGTGYFPGTSRSGSFTLIPQ